MPRNPRPFCRYKRDIASFFSSFLFNAFVKVEKSRYFSRFPRSRLSEHNRGKVANELNCSIATSHRIRSTLRSLQLDKSIAVTQITRGLFIALIINREESDEQLDILYTTLYTRVNGP